MAENPKYKLIGQNYQLNDLVAKVTGRAKYAEDFRAEGMLFAKLLLSPMPHARIRRIDASAALAMPGVVAIITGEDVPKPQQPQQLGEAPAQRANTIPEVAIATEPMYQGEPIAAVAAIDELTATEAIEKIKVEYEPLPFVVDPIVTLRPGGPNARAEGNVWRPPQVHEFKLSAAAVGRARRRPHPAAGRFADPVGGRQRRRRASRRPTDVIDETVVHQSTGHQAMEPRSAMAYWQNGKLYLHGSTQSVARTVANVAQWVGIPQSDQVILISEYTGGGFGGKIPGAHSMAIPALLSKKAGRPVLMRISREEENYIGRARPGIHLRARIGFRKDGRILAMDLCAISDCGPYSNQGDGGTLASTATALYNPETIRFRGISVLTNTPPRVAQRAPGGEQASAMLEPLISKAARQLGVDQVEIRKINAPVTGSEFGPPPPPAQRCGRRGCSGGARGARRPPPLHNRSRRSWARNGARQAAASFRPAACRGRRSSAAPRVLHELPSARSARSGREALQLGRAQNAQRAAPRIEGHGCGRRPRHLYGRVDCDGWSSARPARRQGVRAVGRRQPRDRIRARLRAHRGRGARHAVGAL